MKIFISWSGERSRLMASALRQWMPKVFPTIEPWMSETDIEAGLRWRPELERQLESSDIGVLCLTRENLKSEWLLFEAGALSKSISKIIPVCLDLEESEVSNPLRAFQGVSADRKGTWELIKSINSADLEPMPADSLKGVFEKRWCKLEAQLEEFRAMPIIHSAEQEIVCAGTAVPLRFLSGDKSFRFRDAGRWTQDFHDVRIRLDGRVAAIDAEYRMSLDSTPQMQGKLCGFGSRSGDRINLQYHIDDEKRSQSIAGTLHLVLPPWGDVNGYYVAETLSRQAEAVFGYINLSRLPE